MKKTTKNQSNLTNEEFQLEVKVAGLWYRLRYLPLESEVAGCAVGVSCQLEEGGEWTHCANTTFKKNKEPNFFDTAELRPFLLKQLYRYQGRCFDFVNQNTIKRNS